MKKTILAALAVGAFCLGGCSVLKRGCEIVPIPVLCDSDVCVGDCNGDGTVTADEVTCASDIAVGNEAYAKCAAADANGDGNVSADEVSQVSANAVNGCK